MTKQQRIAQDIITLEQFGSLEKNGYLFVKDGCVLTVYNIKNRQLVAFSAMHADYKQSVEEFLGDFG